MGDGVTGPCRDSLAGEPLLPGAASARARRTHLQQTFRRVGCGLHDAVVIRMHAGESDWRQETREAVCKPSKAGSVGYFEVGANCLSGLRA